jgi:hypothetical protein
MAGRANGPDQPRKVCVGNFARGGLRSLEVKDGGVGFAQTAVIRDSAAQAERKTMLVLFGLFIKTALILKSLFVE